MSHLGKGDDNVFSKIIDGTIPCFKIFETEDFTCFSVDSAEIAFWGRAQKSKELSCPLLLEVGSLCMFAVVRFVLLRR